MERPMGDLVWEEPDVAAPAGRRLAAATGPMLDALLPWQRFLLAALLLLDVTAVGFLFLVMLGRFQFR